MKKYLATILLFALLFTSCGVNDNLETTADGTIITTPDSNPDETPVTPTESTPVQTPATPTESTPVQTPATPVESTPVQTPATPVESTPEETPRGPLEVAIECIEVGKYYSELLELSPEEYDFSEYEEYIEVRNINGQNYFYAKKAGSLYIYIYINGDVTLCDRVYNNVTLSSYLHIIEEYDPKKHLTPEDSVDPFETGETEISGKIESTPAESDTSDEP